MNAVEVSRPTKIGFENVRVRAQKAHLDLSQQEIEFFAGLNTPRRIQTFLDSITYNGDYQKADSSDTSLSPLQVMQRGTAHCWEGLMFATAAGYLNGRWIHGMLLTAREDLDHNIGLIHDRKSRKFGSVAKANNRPAMEGREFEFNSFHELAKSYHTPQYSDPDDPKGRITMVGYSVPFNIIRKFGTAWIGSREELWPLYDTYIRASDQFFYLDGDKNPHPYPMNNAIKNGWVWVDDQGKGVVNIGKLPSDAAGVYEAYWVAMELGQESNATILADKLFNIIGISPSDLKTMAEFDLAQLLKRAVVSEGTATKRYSNFFHELFGDNFPPNISHLL